MRRSFHILFVICSLSFVLAGCSSKADKKVILNTDESQGKTKPILLNVNSFEAGFQSKPNAQIIDVRTPEEFKDGYIKGAININYQGNDFAAEIAKLDKSRPTYVYCRSGGRSSEACNFMTNQDFKEIYDLDGGIVAWKHYNKPIEKPSN